MTRSPTHSETGLSLVEVLVLASLALVLALVAWPRIVRSTLAANEAAAVVTLKEIGQAQLTYSATYPAVGFASRISNLAGNPAGCTPSPERACILDWPQSPYTARGYRFATEATGAGSKTSFFSQAIPDRVGITGQLSFCGTNRWLIHYRSDGQAILNGEICESLPVVR